MQKLKKVFLVLFSVVSFNVFSADEPVGAALEIYQCNFAEGKTIADIRRVSAKWDKWADSNYSVPYAGYLLTPFYQKKSDFPFDLAWLGVAENFVSLGQAQDEWAEKGGRLQVEFDSVSPCHNHAAYYSFTVRRPENQTPNGYLTIRGCNNKEDSTLEKFAAANAKLNKYLDDNNQNSGIYYWFAGAGSGIDQPYDYLEVTSVSTLKEWGAWPDRSLSGNPAPNDLEELRSCDTPRVYTVEYAGSKTIN